MSPESLGTSWGLGRTPGALRRTVLWVEPRLCCAQHQAQPVLLRNRQGLCCGESETPTPELF